MGRLNFYTTETNYNTSKNSFDYPTVAYVDETEEVKWMSIQDKYAREYLTFEALEDGEFAYTICYGEDAEGGGNVYASAKLQYSFNKEDWFDWAIPNETSESINVLANQKLYVRGYTQPLDSAITDYVYGTVKFSSTCRFNVCGLLSSLLYGYDYTNKEFIWTKQPMKTTHFYGLFDNCDKLISAENLILPQELVRECYSNMFYGCTSLTTTPELSATTLAGGCYLGMFSDCESLTTAPELPATTLANDCYAHMFQGCTSLTKAPELPATTMADNCYEGMFYGCTALTTAPNILPATTLALYCYSEMFSGCISLTTAPILPATTLEEEGCYQGMFYGCLNLNYIKAMFTTMRQDSESGEYICTRGWLRNVASTGTFVKNSAAQWNVSGADGIPTGWTVQTASE